MKCPRLVRCGTVFEVDRLILRMLDRSPGGRPSAREVSEGPGGEATEGLQFSVHIDPAASRVLIGDQVRLRQIILNLLGNGIKFTDRGHVSLDVRIDRQSASDALLHFIVTDTGIGIPPEKQTLIFDPSRQVDGSSTRQYEGAGLGLAISARLVRLLGSRIWVESHPDKEAHSASRRRSRSSGLYSPLLELPFAPRR